MLRGLYTAGSGMLVEALRNDVIANNLANAQTTGYKKDVAVVRAFPAMLIRRIDDRSGGPGAPVAGASLSDPAGIRMERLPVVGELGTGSIVDAVTSVFAPGPQRFTGNPLDVAIVGSGFFAVEMPNGVAYTRAGSFTLSADGWLVTQEGRRVIGRSGPIAITGREAHIDDAGRVIVDDSVEGELAIWQFGDPSALRKIGANLFLAAEGAGEPQLVAPAAVASETLEISNVNVVAEMVNLIAVQRAYEASQRAVQAHDQTLGRAVNDIAAPLL